MSTPEQPSQEQLPKKESVASEEQRILNLITTTPEVAIKQQERLQELANQILATTIDPHERQVVQFAVELNDWLLFSNWQQLPKGFCFDEIDQTICCDERAGVGNSCLQFADDRLVELGFEEIEHALTSDYKSRESELADTLSSVVQQSASFAYVRAFRPKQYGEQPLDKFARMQRTHAIGQAVRLEHQIGHLEPLWRGSNAAIDFRRRAGKVDLETTLASLPPISDAEALLRCRTHFKSLMLQIVQESNPELKDLRLEFTEHGKTSVITNEATGMARHHSTLGLAEDVAQKICEQFESESAVRLAMGSVFLSEFIYEVLTNRSATFEGAISKTFGRVIKSYVHDSRPMVGIEIEHRGGRCLRYLLHDTQGEVPRQRDCREGSVLKGWHNGYHERGLGYLTERRMKELKAMRMGRVISDDAVALGGRLVQLQPRQDLVVNEEFTHAVELYDLASKGADPSIPGYVLCYRSNDIFGFRKDESDPYTPCMVELPAAQVPVLAHQYRMIGLGRLAEDLASLKNGTVSDLRSLIRAHCADYAPRDEQEIEIRHLADFEGSVEDERLLIQCSVATTFLKLSLEELFGKGCAGVTRGEVIHGEEISALGHMQTTFAYKEKTYILDATLYDDVQTDYRHDTRATAPSSPRWVPGNVIQVVLRQPYSFKQEKVDLTEQVERRIGVLVQAADRQDMYERVMRLKPHDPIRKTLELSLQILQGKAGGDDITAALQYVSAFLQQRELAKELKLPEYNDTTIHALRHTYDNLNNFLGINTTDRR